MRTFDPAAVAALEGAVLSVAQLVYMGFPGFPIALSSSIMDIDFAGVTYRGAAGLGTISSIDDSPGEVKGLQFTMSGVPTEYLGLALADSAIVQGAPVTIRLAVLAGAVLFDAPIDWEGRLDTMSIEENGDTCTISVTAESNEVDFLRGSPLTYSHVDQQALFPGDMAFEYVLPQEGKPIVWAGKQWLIALNGR